MKVLIPVLALLASVRCTNMSAEDIQATFDELLVEDDIDLGNEYDYRLQLFAFNILGASDSEPITLELMYTPNELKKQNGAVLLNGLTSDEELQKREDAILRRRSGGRSSSYDSRNKFPMNKAVNQMSCGNCYLHAFVASLEIAYAKATGQLVKFSEQEMTDCYFRGCGGGDYRMVTLTMSYIDKLGTKASYTKLQNGYVSDQVTCRGGSSPDFLNKIKVVDFVHVTAETAEQALKQYGSIMTCMYWPEEKSHPCYMHNYDGTSIVTAEEVKDGCDHAVVIVGYNDRPIPHYIVRNSHGTSWGDDGYFKIAKGTNACGIEQGMAAIVTSVRLTRKQTNSNGCPRDKPKLCKEISACIADSDTCAKAAKAEELVKVNRMEEEVVMEEERKVGRILIPGEIEKEVVKEEEVEEREANHPDEIELEKKDKEEADLPNDKREEGRRRKEKPWKIPGDINRVLQKRGVSAEALEEYNNMDLKRSSDEVIEIEEKSCTDSIAVCGMVPQSQACSPPLASHCKKTCNKCEKENKGIVIDNNDNGEKCENQNPWCGPPPNPTLCANPIIAQTCEQTCGLCKGGAPIPTIPPPPPKVKEFKGDCTAPTIANGRVIGGPKLNAGDKLTVVCDTGYTLVGGTVKCLIQNDFANDVVKDARLLPECIKLGGEGYTGKGADYQGTKNTYTDDSGRNIECDSWNKEVLRGIVQPLRNGEVYKVGNHNYCRNPQGTQPVPFCLTRTSSRSPGTVSYCFKYPGCDVCKGAVNKSQTSWCDAAASTGQCEYKQLIARSRVDWYWDRCKASCCAFAGCSLN